jgi:protein-disulfide isomerase
VTDSKKTRVRAAEAEKEAREVLNKRSNRNTLYAVAAIAAAGAGLAAWLNAQGRSAPGPTTESAEIVKVADADLMAPGPLPDIALGNKDAKVTIVEYASMTCPHCATFHAKVYPELKKRYIDTGKARFVFREFPLDSRAAAAAMMARCAAEDKYYPLLSVLFERQESWAFSKGSPVAELKNIAKQAGMAEDAFDKCINDQGLLDKIEKSRNTAADKFGVKSTPTVFVNGKKVTNSSDIAALDAAIEPLLK